MSAKPCNINGENGFETPVVVYPPNTVTIQHSKLTKQLRFHLVSKAGESYGHFKFLEDKKVQLSLTVQDERGRFYFIAMVTDTTGMELKLYSIHRVEFEDMLDLPNFLFYLSSDDDPEMKVNINFEGGYSQ